MKKLLLLIIVLLGSSVIYAQMPLNWYLDEVNPGVDLTLQPEEEFFTEGQRSCHATMNNEEVPYLLSDDFPVNEGASYVFSIDYLDNDVNGVLKFYCDFRDAQGEDVYGEDPVLIETDDPNWRTVEWTGVVPATAVVGYAWIKFYTQESTFTDVAHLWLDNARFIETGQSNAVVNGGFENWTLTAPEYTVAERAIEIYPNPATDYIRILNSRRIDKVLVTDLTGKRVLDIDISGNERIDVSGITPGMYITTLMSGDQLVRNTKLIIR